MNISPYGQNCLLINLEQEISIKTNINVQKLYLAIRQLQLNAITSIIPSYCSITIKYDISKINYYELKETVEQLDYENIKLPFKQEHVIPVCYHESLAPDIQAVCHHTSLSPKEIIELHTKPNYSIYAIGFVPGFFYLGGLDSKLYIPRKETPLAKVPKGSVGVAAGQTGIYPLETPGGWQLIGQTPTSLFDPKQPDKYKMGDTIRFESINITTFKKLCS